MIVGWDSSNAAFRSQMQASPPSCEATKDSSRSRTGSARALSSGATWPRPVSRPWMSGRRHAATPSRTSSGCRAARTASRGRSTPSWRTARPSTANRMARPAAAGMLTSPAPRGQCPRRPAANPPPADGMSDMALWRRLLAELLGSAFLAAVVIGSGIAAQRLSPGDTGLELLENAAATAAGLFAIISMFGPVSGGHFNPVVSFADAAFGGLRWRDAAAYLPAQVAGCVAGAVVANLMFARAAVSVSAQDRSSPGHFLSEVVATLGLILVIFALARSGRSRAAPAAVGAYIGAAYFFTSSTSFANPAITVGRMFSDSFAGIAPSSVPTFVGAQVVGGVLAFAVIKALYPKLTPAEA